MVAAATRGLAVEPRGKGRQPRRDDLLVGRPASSSRGALPLCAVRPRPARYPLRRDFGPIAQAVEPSVLDGEDAGSKPARPTCRAARQSRRSDAARSRTVRPVAQMTPPPGALATDQQTSHFPHSATRRACESSSPLLGEGTRGRAIQQTRARSPKSRACSQRRHVHRLRYRFAFFGRWWPLLQARESLRLVQPRIHRADHLFACR